MEVNEWEGDEGRGQGRREGNGGGSRRSGKRRTYKMRDRQEVEGHDLDVGCRRTRGVLGWIKRARGRRRGRMEWIRGREEA